MSRSVIISIALILLVVIIGRIWWWQAKRIPTTNLNERSTMHISSSAFDHNGTIPSTYTCDSENINPPLSVAAIPDGTKSLALIMDDPDAPNGDWVHWLVWDINPNITTIEQNSVPNGAVEGTTSGGKVGYGGPCPPSGVHHYHFKVYALDVANLGLQPTATKADMLDTMDKHILAQGELIGLYSRKK